MIKIAVGIVVSAKGNNEVNIMDRKTYENLQIRQAKDLRNKKTEIFLDRYLNFFYYHFSCLLVFIST